MLSQVFRVRSVGAGALLRGETRAGRPRGLAAARAMAAGELLPDDLVLQALLIYFVNYSLLYYIVISFAKKRRDWLSLYLF